MRSYNCNSRTSASAACLAAAASLLVSNAASAADKDDHNFTLTAYANGLGGSALVTGHYQEAGKALRYEPGFSASDRSTTSNNRCVFLSVTRQWDAARLACNAAVRQAQQEKASLPPYQYFARDKQDEFLAVALSNRAVLHWMSGETEAAASDLKRAETLAPRSAFVTRNTQALEYSRTAVAQVAVGPGSP